MKRERKCCDYDMKPLCAGCVNGSECWIVGFNHELKYTKDIKKFIMNTLKGDEWYIKYSPRRPSLYLAIALREYYKKYYEWYQKILILK
jgi:hypothetical protein